MKGFWTWALTGAVTLAAGCSTGVGPELSGLWIADSYEYRSVGGQTVDLVERDGASMSLTVDLFLDGRRRASAIFNDGSGGTETLSGEVLTDEGVFVFDTVTYEFRQRDGVLTLVDESATFDFGSGPEPATLVIRLTQL